MESYFGNVNCIGERSCYDEGKRAAETLTFDYMREHGLEVCQWLWCTVSSVRTSLSKLWAFVDTIAGLLEPRQWQTPASE